MAPNNVLGPRWVLALKVHIAVLWILSAPALAVAGWLATEAMGSREAMRELVTREELEDLTERQRSTRELDREALDTRLRSLEGDMRAVLAILERLEKRGTQ